MKNKKVMILLIIFVIVMFIVIGAKTLFGNMEANLEQLKVQKIREADLSKLVDGAYNGSYKAFPIEAEVEVTVENQRIKGINLTKHKHGQGAAAEVITSNVVEAQSLEVDIISGATYSSKVILKAIENALLDANKQ
jgi:uncharacterized protein with FMN-binding domain